MIVIDDNWVIRVDVNGNYMPTENSVQIKTLKRKGGKTDDVEVYKEPIGYYSSLKNAIRGLVDYTARTKLVTDTLTLTEAIKVIQDSNAKFEEMLSKALGDCEC